MRKRKVKKQKFLWLILIVGILVAIILYHTHQTTQHPKSYSVNESATLSKNTEVYESLTIKRKVKLQSTTAVTVNKYYLPTTDDQTTYARIRISDKNYYVNAKNLNLTMTNNINKYVAQLGYPHAGITKQFSSKFTQRTYSTSSGQPHGVVIHDTGTEYSSLRSEVAYMEENYSSTQVFVHTFIDASEILNIANTKYMAEGAGAKANPYFVQFEMPHEYTKASFAKQTANAAYYTAYILKKYNLPVTKGTKDGSGTVWTHSMVSSYLGGTDHEDPVSYWSTSAQQLFGSSYNIDDFIELVQAYYNQI